jgi:hypothetical protein
MVRFLRLYHGAGGMQKLITPRKPFHDPRHRAFGRGVAGLDDAALRALLHSGDDDVSNLVSEIEPDQKGIPVLLRQYLKFGARLLTVNVDPDFSDVVDGLLLADLPRAPRRVLEKYMGSEGTAAYLAHHAGAVSSAAAQPGGDRPRDASCPAR